MTQFQFPFHFFVIRNHEKRKIYIVMLSDKILIAFVELNQEGLSWQVTPCDIQL